MAPPYDTPDQSGDPKPQPLIGPEVRYPTPWRCAEVRGGFQIITDAEGSEAARVGAEEGAIAELIVRLVNEAAARGVTR